MTYEEANRTENIIKLLNKRRMCPCGYCTDDKCVPEPLMDACLKQDFVINKAIEALEKVEKYRWHDLRKNPEDLPMDKGKYLVAYRRGKERNIQYADVVFYGHRWCVLAEIKVLGWKYIDPF